MIYFLYSDNTEEGNRAVNKKAAALVADLVKKKPDAGMFTLTDENWNEAAIDEYTASQGLFEKKYIVLMKDILSGGNSTAKKERKELFLEKIELFAESPNIFIMAEPGIDMVTLKKLEKHAEKVQEIKPPVGQKEGQKGGGKIFDLADALGAKDKKRLWTLYRKAIDDGKVPEEIHGILFWQIKSMIIASRVTTATLSGLNPYVFSKAKSYAENFSKEELAKILEKIVAIYHDAHRGLHDFETAIEIFILEL